MGKVSALGSGNATRRQIASLQSLARFSALLAIGIAALGLGCQSSRSRFYPLGIYSVPDTNDFPVVKEAGFNTVAGRADSPYLNAATRSGLRVLASPNTSSGPQFDARAAQSAVAAFDRHPALWAWYLVDEPDLVRISPEDVIASHQFLKRAGAKKPTALVLYQGYSAADFGQISDILMIDRYPIPWLPLANFPQHVRMARLGAGPKRPLIAVIQAFDWQYYPDLIPGEEQLRPPTGAELRCMTYLALAHRANGLFYYCFNDGRWKMSEHPDVWDAIKGVVAEVNERLPLFQADHQWWPYIHRFRDPKRRFNRALESSVTPALLRVRYGNSAVPAGDYILAVNNTELKQGYQFTVPEGVKFVLPVFGEDRFVPIIDGWAEDEFEPFAVRIYGPLL